MWKQQTRGGFDGTMPFGKHKGERLEDVPEGYLRWVLENCERISASLRRAIEEQLGKGSDEDEPPHRPWTPPPSSHNLRATLDAEVQRLRRKYAATMHPDRGGSKEAMAAVNSFADDVLKAIAEMIR